MTPDEKRCAACGATQPLTDFYRDRSRPDGHRSICKGCDLAKARVSYTANRTNRLRRQKAYYRRNKLARRAYQREYARKRAEAAS